MTKPVTKAKAEQVLAAVKTQFQAEPEYGPALVQDFYDTGHWAVVWEEGPYDWALNAFTGGVDEEATALLQEFKPGGVIYLKTAAKPAGVWTEPYTGWALMVYPDN